MQTVPTNDRSTLQLFTICNGKYCCPHQYDQLIHRSIYIPWSMTWSLTQIVLFKCSSAHLTNIWSSLGVDDRCTLLMPLDQRLLDVTDLFESFSWVRERCIERLTSMSPCWKQQHAQNLWQQLAIDHQNWYSWALWLLLPILTVKFLRALGKYAPTPDF